MSRQGRRPQPSDRRRYGPLEDWDATSRGTPNDSDRQRNSTTSYEDQLRRSFPSDFPLPIEGQRRSHHQNTNPSSRARARAPLEYHAAGSSSTPSLPRPSDPRRVSGREEHVSNRDWSALPSQLRGVGLNMQRPLHRNSNHISAPPILRGPGRKAASTAPVMWNPSNEPQSFNISRMTATPRKRPPIEIVKSIKSPKPLWQHQDDEHEAQQKIERRMDKRGELNHHPIPRKHSSVQPRRAYLSPALQIVQDPLFLDNGKENEGMEEHHMEVDQPPRNNVRAKLGSGSTIPKRVIDLANKKAARKFKSSAPLKEDSDSESNPPSSSGSSSTDSVIELTDDENDSENEPANEEERINKLPPPEDEIVIIEPPQPVITIPLPQIAPVVPQPLLLASEPPTALVSALEEFCLPSTRMQKTRQLPFLLRNLRRGFRIRCSSINIKTGRARPKMPVVVRYEYAESVFEVRMEKWLCPICELHGTFPNKEMLRCHFQWDHPEVILERWEQRTNNSGKAEWRMHIMIPEVTYESIPPRDYDLIAKLEPREISIDSDRSQTISTRSSSHISSVFREAATEPPESRDITPSIDFKQDLFRELVLKKLHARDGRHLKSITPSSHRSQSTLTDQTEESLSTIRVEHTPGPPGGLYPTPPPVHDPLGPAAQSPYLPAESEYGGPDIHYSCRPGGPSTFDLLSTLPMEPFGVLEWDILEREEEIYESDDVKVEYKVMHALWSRWISLHRLTFIENHYKGITAFIDEYWRIIHQAAGWKAMRYWLLGLFAHRYLTIREVARALKHYEQLTGMSFW